ncbi:MAG: hypothetical protein Q7S16_05675 [bacterium]|nr:hypothetical protein [bacterium]
MEDKIKKIIAIAVNAPSGDNMQPWRFALTDQMLDLYNIPTGDTSPYNMRQRGSLIAHGAVLENIDIVAPTFGLQSSVQLFPTPDDKTHIAHISFTEVSSRIHPFAATIEQRCTNRLPYDKIPLTDKTTQALDIAVGSLKSLSLSWVRENDEKDELGRILSLNERLILENEKIHDAIFSIIRWTNEDEQATNDGLFIKTLELAPPQRFAFRIFSNWRRLSKIRKLINVGKLVSKDTAKLYASSGAFGLFTIDDESDTTFVTLGRALERLWLTATNMGLSIQPVTALPYLYQRIKAGDANFLSLEQQREIENAAKAIRMFFHVPQTHTTAFLFRIGVCRVQPSARSRKRAPFIV